VTRSGELFSVVFVCTGNVIRSPVAAALLRRAVEGAPIHVDSCGLLDLGPVPAHPEAILAAHALGLDLRDHRARALAQEELQDVDLVLGFEPSHLSAAIVDGGAPPDRVFTIVELADLLERMPPGEEGVLAEVVERVAAGRGNPLRAPAVADPVRAGGEAIGRTVRTIDTLVARIARVLVRVHARPVDQ
jgi:protein-tyrosine phosphatase